MCFPRQGTGQYQRWRPELQVVDFDTATGIAADDDPRDAGRIDHAVEAILARPAVDIPIVMISSQCAEREVVFIECLENDRVESISPDDSSLRREGLVECEGDAIRGTSVKEAMTIQAAS